jgi:hypothetical protein
MKMLKLLASLSLLAGIVFVFGGCAATPQDYAKNQAAAQAWLDSHTAPARIDVSGKWDAGDWGTADLRQSGRRVTGNIDRYAVKGVVSGRRVYLTIWEENWCYYMAELVPAGKGVLQGTYAGEPPYNPKKVDPMVLTRVR